MKNNRCAAAGFLLAVLSGILLAPPGASGATTNYYHVAPGGSATVPYDTWGKAANDIQAAVDKASADLVPGTTECVVLVTNGTWTLSSQILITNGITLRGLSLNPGDTVLKGGYPVSTNRCLYVAQGTVEGFSITNGYVDVTCSPSNWGGGVFLTTDAVLRNCRIVGNQAFKGVSANGHARGGGVYMLQGGTMDDCVVSSNAVNQGMGAGIFMDYGGDVINCSIISNRDVGASLNGCFGGGVYLDHEGVISNCLIAFNTTPRNGGGIYQSYGGRVTACTVRDNTASSSTGGGFYLDRGPCLVERCRVLRNTANGGAGILVTYNDIVQDCLIAGNYSTANGGGIQVNNASVRSQILNCTIVRNSAALTCGGLQVTYANAVDIYNTIVYDNGAPAGKTNDIGGVLLNNTNMFSCYGDTDPAFLGTGCITNNPLFADSGSGAGLGAVLGDYNLQTNSPCIGAGTNGMVVTSLDLDGNNRTRPAWGVVDMGAYESIDLRGALTNGFSASPPIGAAPLQVVLTGETGGDTNGILYRWSFGDGATNDWSADRVVSHLYAQARTNAYTVILEVTNAAGETSTCSGSVMVYPAIAYVATNGTHVSPFDTWGKAATDIQSAIAVAGAGFTTVLVSNGVYAVTNEITIDKAVTVRGFSGNWNDVVVRGGYPATINRCMKISAAGAVVDGFTITNGNLGALNFAGGGVNMTAGTIQNCLVIGNTARGISAAGGSGAGIYCAGGSVLNCAIRNNVSTYSDGAGIYSSGLVSNCLVSGNVSAANGGGARLVGAGVSTIDRCVIVNNTANTLTGGGGGIYKSNSGLAKVRNSLVAGNLSRYAGGGIYFTTGTLMLENCTLVGNLATNGGGVYASIVGLTGTNCIVVNNRSLLASATNDIGGLATNFGYSCSPSFSYGDGNTTADPLFVSSGSGYGTNHVFGDYHLKAGSPCADTGANLAGMSLAVDLEGEPRILGAGPNMGAFEKVQPAKGTLLLIR